MLEIAQTATWPGVLGVESCQGTLSHGIAPATFALVTYPQAARPAERGTLTISDGVRRPLALRDCKVSNVVGRSGADGQTWVLDILDRRWKWQTGAISGRYNQLDPRGKLVPWSIRSPKELAVLCLKAAGETNYLLFLPDGLTEAAGRNFDRFLQLGENFPQSLANPPVEWDVIPPMVALSQLAARYGCRVMWQPVGDRVVVGPPGAGAGLPDGPCEVITPSLDAPETPSHVAVAGAPVPIQMKLLLEPVGEDWHGGFVPVNDLTYAPQGAGAVQISTVTWDGVTANPSVKVYITYQPVGGGAENTVGYEYSDAVAASVKFTRIAGEVNANPGLRNVMTAAAAGDVLTLTGKQQGYSFGVRSETSVAAPDRLYTTLVQPAGVGGGDWSWCRPPNYKAVLPTDRLSYDEAVALARKTVYRCYRVVDVDVSTGKYPISVPYYTTVTGKRLKRRQQLVLQQYKVETVKPAPRVKGGRVRGVPGNPFIQAVLGGILPEFYNGYRSNRPASVTGSVAKVVGSVMWDSTELNTEKTAKVYVPFSIDPVEQVVTFAEPVWRQKDLGAGPITLSLIDFPTLVLETAAFVTDDSTGALYRWVKSLALGGSAPPAWSTRDDVQVGVVAEYDDENVLKNTTLKDENDAHKRADYYLAGMANRYRRAPGETRQYIGIYPHDLDGYCWQATYSVGAGGATTVLSANSEHSDVIPDYPARQNGENLPPDKVAAVANAFSRPPQLPDAT